MNIADIKPYTKNAKEHTPKQIKLIAESIKRFGFLQPVVIDKNNEIVAGHGRYEAAKILGLTDVPVVKADTLTDQEIKAYRLADNQINALTGFDMGLAVEELKELDADLFDITGFDKDLLIEPDDKDDQIPENAPTIAKFGDIWQLGRHRVLCGDSTDKNAVERLMDGKKAGMVFTDPPYNVDYVGKTKKKLTIQNDKLSNFYEFLSQSIGNAIDFCKGGMYICMGTSELHTLKQAFENGGGHWQGYIIWVKNNFTFASLTDYRQMYEPILYGWPKRIKNHYFIDNRDTPNVWEDMRKVKTEKEGEYTVISFSGFKVRIKGNIEKGEVIRKKQYIDIWRHDKPSKSEEHPTMKPVALMEQAIMNSSQRDDIVLDIFLGSGSTLIASEKTERICYGMELEPRYLDVIIKRFEDYSGQKAVRMVK